jgi:hypothetical protein
MGIRGSKEQRCQPSITVLTDQPPEPKKSRHLKVQIRLAYSERRYINIPNVTDSVAGPWSRFYIELQNNRL